MGIVAIKPGRGYVPILAVEVAHERKLLARKLPFAALADWLRLMVRK